MKNSPFVLLISALLLTSCHKEEIAIAPHNSGSALEAQIEMGEDYRYQLFYDLEANEVVRSNDKVDWDLAFESSPTGWHIVLNSSRGMAVHGGSGAFADITSETGLTWGWDTPDGNLDSTAIGDWQADNGLYVIDMGYDHTGSHLGYRKLIIAGMTSAHYTIQYGELSDITPQTTSISKNTNYVMTHYKFDAGVVPIAPANDDWDLLFTQYTHLFYNPFDAYLVTGVLLNRFNTSASHIADKPFSEISYDDAIELNYSDSLDYIGYDWKFYDYTNHLYLVDPTITYLIRTSEGFYYKLHFVDFYNNLGEKGYPKLEVQKL